MSPDDVAALPDPYALVSRFYEAEYGHLEADVAMFSRHSPGGRLLVLGCGTGRVARRLAVNRAVVGLDRSEPMLELARQLAPEVSFVQGDMRDFSLGPFREIIVPNGAFAFLPRRADQEAALQACRRALVDGNGRMTIDLPMPSFHLWASPHTPARLAWEGEVDEQPCRRTREIRRSFAQQRLDLIDRYYVGAEAEPRVTSRLVLRIIMPAELEWMLEASGFYIDDLYGDYSGGPVRDDCPRIIARAALL